MMKAENDRLQGEVEKLRQKLREEITRTQANVRLDLHLEKGRIRDEASAQEIKIKETDTRIESEIAGLRTQMEAIKFQILQYMIGKYLHVRDRNIMGIMIDHHHHHHHPLQVQSLVLELYSSHTCACSDDQTTTIGYAFQIDCISNNKQHSVHIESMFEWFILYILVIRKLFHE